MRATNAGIDAVLASPFRKAADLFTIYFAEGTQRWTSGDTSLTYGGNTWLPSGPIITRGGGRRTAGLEVDGLQLALAPGLLTLGGQTVKLAALRGSFNNVRVQLQRAYMSTWGTIPGLLDVFDGSVVDVQVSSTEVRVVAKSVLSKLSNPGPARLLQAQCQWQFGSTACGATLASWQHTRTAALGSTASSLVLSLASTNAVVGGIVAFTSGALVGTRRAIKAVAGATLTLSLPLGAAPAVGDGVTVTNGCPKTRPACVVFGRIASFGGFPDTPKPAATASAASGPP